MIRRLRLVLPCLLAALGLPATAAQEPVPDTVIESQSCEITSTDTQTLSIFTGNVIVTGNNIRITCDRLDVVSLRSGDQAGHDRQAGALQVIRGDGQGAHRAGGPGGHLRTRRGAAGRGSHHPDGTARGDRPRQQFHGHGRAADPLSAASGASSAPTSGSPCRR